MTIKRGDLVRRAGIPTERCPAGFVTAVLDTRGTGYGELQFYIADTRAGQFGVPQSSGNAPQISSTNQLKETP